MIHSPKIKEEVISPDPIGAVKSKAKAKKINAASESSNSDDHAHH